LHKIFIFIFCSAFLYAETIILDEVHIEDATLATTTHEISKELIKKTQSISITDILETDVSFNRTSVGDGSRGISFRGLDFKTTEYIEDGIPLYRSTGGLIDTNFYMPNANISFNDGSGISSTGVSSMGGQVKINSTVPSKELELKVGSSLSTNDEFYYTTLGSAIDNYYVQADVNYYNRENFDLSDDYSPTPTQGKGNRINSDKEQTNVSLKTGVFLSDELHLAAKFSYQKTDYGLAPNIYAFTSTDPFAFLYTRVEPKELRSYYLYADYDVKDYEYSLRAYYDDYKDKFTIYSDISYSTKWPTVTYDDSRLGAIFKATRNKEFRKSSFIFLSERNKHKRTGGDMPDATTELATYKPSFLHVEKLSEAFELEGGLSYTLMKEIQAADASALSATEDKEAFDAQLKLSYQDKKNTLYLGVAKKSRMPTMAEMFAFFAWEVPNPNLKPEKSWQYTSGYKYALSEKSTIDASIYYYDIKDLIIESNSGFINKNSAEHYGAEFRYKTTYFDINEIGLAYAYAHTKDSDGEVLALIPKNKVILQDTVHITKHLDGFLSYTYMGTRYSYNYPIDLNTQSKLDTYNVFDVQVSYALKDKLSARVGIKNITDEDYEWQYGFPAEGRSFYASLEWVL